MGNRAIITTAPYDEDNVGIYCHWNGGQESIEGFVRAAKDLGYRDPSSDPEYGLARLTQAIGVFFGGELSLGIGICKNLDDSDQGTWLLGPGWEISHLKRKVVKLSPEQEEKAEEIRKAIVTKTARLEEKVDG